MKNLMIALCFGCFLYSCSTNDPEPEQKIVYVDKIIEVPVPIMGGEYPDSLKWFMETHPDFVDYRINKFKDQSGLVIVSYGDNSFYNKNDLSTTKKLPWHSISVVVYSSATNGALTPSTRVHYIIHLNGAAMWDATDAYNSWESSESGYNSNFYGDGQIVIKTFTNP